VMNTKLFFRFSFFARLLLLLLFLFPHVLNSQPSELDWEGGFEDGYSAGAEGQTFDAPAEQIRISGEISLSSGYSYSHLAPDSFVY